MICPNCNQIIQDGAKACPLCGVSFVNNIQQPNANLLSRPSPPMSIQQQAAQQELDKINPSDIRLSLILTIVGVCGMIYGIISKSEHSAWVEIVSIFMVVICGADYLNKKVTKEQMEAILDDKKRKAICPYCKSPNIKQKFVKASTVRGKSRTRVSKNINPFHPFSYRNYDTKPVSTNYNYKNTYSCQTCGAVFDSPQIFEYQ